MSGHPDSRRAFLKTAALFGGSAAASRIPDVLRGLPAAEAAGAPYPLAEPERLLYSVCQQCNTQCGIKVKLHDGIVAKIDGNPYSPWNMVPHLPYATPVIQAAAVEGALCPKGQAGIQTAYDPYRIVKVLKRAGKRGENKWRSIPFDQAIARSSRAGSCSRTSPARRPGRWRGSATCGRSATRSRLKELAG